MGFDLSDYEPVEDRLRRFWSDHPEGRVLTSLIAYSDTQFIVRAEVYFDRDDDRPVASGYAEETVTTRGVNQTSALENGETSSIGRALANAGYAPKGKRPSREEMGKVQRRTAEPNTVAASEDDVAAAAAAITAALLAETDEALRLIWTENKAVLDVPVQGRTLRVVASARKKQLEAAA